MQSQARKQFVLAVLSGLVVAAAVAASPAHAAESCRLHRDFAVGNDPLLAAVRPADCATLLGNPPEFTWAQQGGATYTVALTFPDGHTETRSTPQNWLAWDRPVPTGDYSWRVTTSGAVARRSDARAFHVDAGGALPAQPTVAIAGHRGAAAASSASGSPVFELETSPSWIPSVRSVGVGRKAATGGFFGGFTE
jgi:hypothetical protein